MADPLPPGKYPGRANSPVGEAIRAGKLPGGAEGIALRDEWEKKQEAKRLAQHSNVLIDAGVKNGKG